ncbi:uncharacterized protein RHOBADRAFT_54851, partial [Rhodotorula graminis WP1]
APLRRRARTRSLDQRLGVGPNLLALLQHGHPSVGKAPPRRRLGLRRWPQLGTRTPTTRPAARSAARRRRRRPATLRRRRPHHLAPRPGQLRRRRHRRPRGAALARLGRRQRRPRPRRPLLVGSPPPPRRPPPPRPCRPPPRPHRRVPRPRRARLDRPRQVVRAPHPPPRTRRLKDALHLVLGTRRRRGRGRGRALGRRRQREHARDLCRRRGRRGRGAPVGPKGRLDAQAAPPPRHDPHGLDDVRRPHPRLVRLHRLLGRVRLVQPDPARRRAVRLGTLGLDAGLHGLEDQGAEGAGPPRADGAPARQAPQAGAGHLVLLHLVLARTDPSNYLQTRHLVPLHRPRRRPPRAQRPRRALALLCRPRPQLVVDGNRSRSSAGVVEARRHPGRRRPVLERLARRPAAEQALGLERGGQQQQHDGGGTECTTGRGSRSRARHARRGADVRRRGRGRGEGRAAGLGEPAARGRGRAGRRGALGTGSGRSRCGCGRGQAGLAGRGEGEELQAVEGGRLRRTVGCSARASLSLRS